MKETPNFLYPQQFQLNFPGIKSCYFATRNNLCSIRPWLLLLLPIPTRKMQRKLFQQMSSMSLKTFLRSSVKSFHFVMPCCFFVRGIHYFVSQFSFCFCKDKENCIENERRLQPSCQILRKCCADKRQSTNVRYFRDVLFPPLINQDCKQKYPMFGCQNFVKCPLKLTTCKENCFFSSRKNSFWHFQ